MANNFAVNGAPVNGSTAVGSSFVVRARIAQQIIGGFTVSAVIAQSIFTDVPVFTDEKTWAARVTLNGADISSKVLGEITVEAEEDAARVADFVFVPDTGAIDVTAWTGASVTIDYQTLSAGVITYTERLFTGVIDVPEYDPIKNVVKMNCTDDLQNVTSLLTREEIDAITSDAFYNDRMGSPDLEGFEYLLERMKSVIGTYDLSPTRKPRQTDWAIKQFPDFTFIESTVEDESVAVTIAQAKDITNKIDIDFKYRYLRLKERVRTGSWAFPGTVCDWLETGRTLPNQDMVINALTGSGWNVKSVNFVDVEPNGVVICGGGNIVVSLPEEIRSQVIFGATWTVMRRYSQNIEENYTIHMQAPQSTNAISPRCEKRSAGFTAEFDDSEWKANDLPETIQIGTQQVGGGAGDTIRDITDEEGFTRADAEESLDFVIVEAKKDLLDSHRKNTVAFDVIIDPRLDVTHTIRINTARIQATGKCKALLFTMDTESGEAKTEITLAISRGFGTSIFVETELNRPAVPDSLTPGTANPLSGSTTGSQYGAQVASGAFDAEQDGYSGNYAPTEPGATNIYPIRFMVDGEAIDGGDVSELIATSETTYYVAIPNDELVLVAP